MLSFQDLDLDLDELGGLVSWKSPEKMDLVEGAWGALSSKRLQGGFCVCIQMI